eukprot:m.1203739 g.1203739  ORF g.1203739 m.1203739 type:complete len:1155 (-) comp24579_c0_seq15:3325-6789(-)
MAEENVKVAVRVRPFNSREKERNPELVLQMNGPVTTIRDPTGQHSDKSFTFDHSYWSHSGFEELEDKSLKKLDDKYASQEDVFNDLGKGVLQNAYDGYNTSLFAYGQTGAGKSYSMVGYGPNKGIVPMAFEELFRYTAANESDNLKFQVTFSMLEIYMEQVEDLLADPKLRKKGGLKVRQNPKLGRFYVDGLSKVPVASYEEIANMMDTGTANRTVAATQMNATSSRAHTVVTLQFDQIITDGSGAKTTKQSEVNLVDLAGSERAGSTGATGDRLKEGAQINKSLSALGNVISALATNKKAPFRDSVLTKLLQNSLGGNSKTIMIAALSPAGINYDETLGTLRYADRAKQIKTKAAVNESATDKLIRELREDNERLKSMLEGGSMEQLNTDGKTDEEISKMKRKAQAAMLAQIKNTEDMMARLDGTAHEEQSEYWKNQYAHAAQQDADKASKMATEPHLINLNEDPALSGVVVHFLKSGSNAIGRKAPKAAHDDSDVPIQPDIQLTGLSIEQHHAEIIVEEDGSTVKLVQPNESIQDKLLVNGEPTCGEVILQHKSRILFGTNHLYVFHNPKQVDDEGETVDVDWDFAQKEIQDKKPTFESDAMGDDIKEEIQKLQPLLPMLAFANDISKEMNKNRTFEFAYLSPLFLGETDGPSCGMIKMTNTVTGNDWYMSVDEFIQRRFRMEEVFRSHQQSGEEAEDDEEDEEEEEEDQEEDQAEDHEGEDDDKQESDAPATVPESTSTSSLRKTTDMTSATSDPFAHDAADVFIGSANVPLDGLAYNFGFDDDVFISDCQGFGVAVQPHRNFEIIARNRGTLEVVVQPCQEDGEADTELGMVEDPEEMLGKTLFFKLSIKSAFLKNARVSVGVKLSYFHEFFLSDPVWVDAAPSEDGQTGAAQHNSLTWNHSNVLSIPKITPKHLEWLQNAGVLKLVLYATQSDAEDGGSSAKASGGGTTAPPSASGLSKDVLSRVVDEYRNKQRSHDNLLDALEQLLSGAPVCDADGGTDIEDKIALEKEATSTTQEGKSALENEASAAANEGNSALEKEEDTQPQGDASEALRLELKQVTAELDSVKHELEATKQAQSEESKDDDNSTNSGDGAALTAKNVELQREVTDLARQLEVSEMQVRDLQKSSGTPSDKKLQRRESTRVCIVS